MVDESDRHRLSRISKKEIDMYRKFLEPTTADNQESFYGPVRPLIGPELSVANVDKEDGIAYRVTILFIQEAFANGLDNLGMEEMLLMTAELKLSMSREGKVLEHIFSNKIEYAQTQNVHEYMHTPPKRGLFSGKPKNPT